MIKYMLPFLLLSCVAHSATIDYVKPEWCVYSFPFGMVVGEKLNANTYLVSQNSQVLAPYGVVQTNLSKRIQKAERLNILVQYVKTKTMRGADGFDYAMDVWRECKYPIGRDGPRKRSELWH